MSATVMVLLETVFFYAACAFEVTEVGCNDEEL
jgi:hypothetical protein